MIPIQQQGNAMARSKAEWIKHLARIVYCHEGPGQVRKFQLETPVLLDN